MKDVLHNRSTNFWTALICTLFSALIVLMAALSYQYRNSTFESQIDAVKRAEINAIENIQTDLVHEALLMAQLIKDNQAISQLLRDAAALQPSPALPQTAPAETVPPETAPADGSTAELLAAMRQQLQQLSQPYWQSLQAYGVRQLHFHLANNAVTLYRAHNPQMHGDSAAKLRPMLMSALNSGKAQVGLEIGQHGIGLRAIVPVFNQNQVVAAVEVGYALNDAVLAVQQVLGEPNTMAAGSAFIYRHDIVNLLPETLRGTIRFTDTATWGSDHDDLMQTQLTSYLPEIIHQPLSVVAEQQDKTVLLTYMPWHQFAQANGDAKVILLRWYDLSARYQQRLQNEIIINLSWFVMLIFGMYSVFFVSQKIRQSTALVIKAKQADLVSSQQQLQALFALSPDAILLSRLSNGAYEDANPATLELTGYSAEELRSQHGPMLIPDFQLESSQSMREQLDQTGKYGPIRTQILHKNGSTVDLELRGVLFHNTNGDSLLWTIITDLREQLKLERMKQDFISTVSHELRTPLTSVNGSLDLLLAGIAGELPAKAAMLLSIAAKNNKRLITLVNDLLDMEKLAQGKLAFHIELINSATLLHSAWEQHQQFAELHQVKLQLGQVDDAIVQVDPGRIQQVLANLISNAAKFSAANTVVLLESKRLGDRVRFTVTDQGSGLTDAQIALLFQRFSQLSDVNNRQHEGSGLGLVISKDIVQQSGGQIGVTSQLDCGSTFWFELPIAEPRGGSAQGKRLLIVEDDPDIALTLKEMLVAEGYDVDIALAITPAWELVQQRHYDLVTLDLKLNGENGCEFFLKLRDTPAYRDMPVLVVSAFIQQGKLQLQAIAHTVDWLAKPINPELLLSKIKHLLRQNNHSLATARVLHVEDDPDIVAIMQMQFDGKFHYQHAGSLADARAYLTSEHYDLILLDIGLPDGTGWQLLPDLQSRHSKVPVIIFSAQDISPEQAQQASAVFGKTKIEPAALVEYISQMLSTT